MEPIYLSISLAFLLAGLPAILLLWLNQPDESPVAFDIPAPEACKASWAEKATVLEKPSIQTSDPGKIQCYCPANGRLLGRVPAVNADGITEAVARAEEAQIEWAQTTFSQRRKVLRTLLQYILKHQDDLVKVACLDSGKPRVDAAFGEVLITVEKLSWLIRHGEKVLSPERRPVNLLLCYKHNEVRYEPLGVVAACVSWNYPAHYQHQNLQENVDMLITPRKQKFHNIVNPIIASIFAGNAIVVKGSEQTAWSAHYYTTIVRAALAVCQQPYEIVQNVSCWPSVAPTLTSHPSISHLTFIGSRPVGLAVAASAAESLTPLCVELGGKDAAIVLDDVKNMEKVASFLMRGVFQSAGQNCIGVERVIATPCAYTRLLEIIEPRIAALRVGSPLDEEEDVDVGACISDARFDRLEELISGAAMDGAELLCGGTRLKHPRWPAGHFFSPTLLAGVTADMAIAQEELFAPVFVLMRAATAAEAVAIANATPYGLGCSVFGTNKAALDKVVRGVRVGMVAVNDFGTYYLANLPFGGAGAKASGYGRFGGPEGLRALCSLKSVCRDRWPALLSTSIPSRLDYAVKREDGAKAKAWEFVKGVVELGYAPTLVGKAKAVGKLIKYG